MARYLHQAERPGGPSMLAGASLVQHGGKVIMRSTYASMTNVLLGQEIPSVGSRKQSWHSQAEGI